MRLPSIRSPSRRLALLAGAAFGFAMPLLHSWQAAAGVSAQASRLVFLAALVGLFFAPILLFVVGIAHLSFGGGDSRSPAFRASLGRVGVRALCWLIGAGSGFAALAVIRHAGLP